MNRKYIFLIIALLIINFKFTFSQVPASLGLSPIEEFQPWSIPNDFAGSRGFVYNGAGPFQFNTQILNSTTLLPKGAPVSFGFPAAASYNEPTKTLWVCDQMAPYTLYTVDTATGIRTTICNITACPENNLTGIAWNRQGTVLYGQTTSITTSSLGTINTITGVFSPIGPPSTILCGAIALACSYTGTLFSVDIVADNLYKINRTTGAVSLVGALGCNANFSQDAQFDMGDNRLYWASYTTSYPAGPQLRTIDTITGNGLLMGTYASQVMTIGICPKYVDIKPDLNTIDINIYPNPTSDYVRISCSNIQKIEILSLAGQVLQKREVYNDFTELSFAEYDAGVYIIKVSTATYTICKRITVLK